jgi:hypothetical protein
VGFEVSCRIIAGAENVAAMEVCCQGLVEEKVTHMPIGDILPAKEDLVESGLIMRFSDIVNC